MEKHEFDNDLKEFASRLNKYLAKEKELMKIYDEELYNNFNNPKYMIITIVNETVKFDDFIKLFFILINIYNNLKEKKVFFRLSYKIINYLNNSNIKINIQSDNFLKFFTEGFISNVNSILVNDNEVKTDNKMQKYLLSFIEFTIKYMVSNFTLKYNFFLIEALFKMNSTCTQVIIRDKCKHLIFRICDNIEYKIVRRLEEYYQHFSFDDNHKSIKDALKFYNDQFDCSFYSYEYLKCKDVVDNLVDNICLYDKKYTTLSKNSNQNNINSIESIPIKCIPDIDNFDKYKNLKFVQTHNEKNVISGRFGWCNFCRNTADFYCIKYRLPVCSLGCKNKIAFREKFSENFEMLIKKSDTIFQDFQKDIVEFLNELCTKLIEEDYLVNSQNDFKLKFELILKFFKCLSCSLSNESFEDIKKNVIKVLGKFIYFGDYVIVSISLNILLVISKKFGNLIKNEIKFLFLDIFLKIFESNEYFKVNLVIKYLIQIFHTNSLENFLFFHSNFDLVLYQPDLNRILLDSIFKFLKEDKKDKQIKIKMISLVNKIIVSLIKFSYSNCILISKKLFNLLQKDKSIIKNSLYICRDKFNLKPKDIVSHIENNLDNNNNFFYFANDEKLSKQEKVNKIIIHILRNCYGIDKEKIGDFLSEPKDLSKVLINQFLSTFNFQNTHIIEALRKLLFCIKLPGEAQKIDRFMESFAKKYYYDNPNVFESSDPVYYLCFSIIMLQTDMHNPNVKKKMSASDYIKNLSGQNNGKNFDPLFLEDIYETLKKKPFLFFNYDNTNNSQLTQNDDVTIKNFFMNIDLSEKENWDLNINKNDIFYVSKMIFQSFYIEFEALFYDNYENGVEYYKILYLTIINFIELLNFLHLKNDRISLVNFILKVLCKDTPLNIQKVNVNMVTFISSFVEVIVKKPNLFFGTWINTVRFIFYYYNNLLKIVNDKNSYVEDETKTILLSLWDIFKKDKIENYFNFGLKFSNDNLIDLIKAFFFNLKNGYHELVNSSVLLINTIVKKLLLNFSKNNDIWECILSTLEDYFSSLFREKIEKEQYELVYDLIRFTFDLFMKEIKKMKEESCPNCTKICQIIFKIQINDYVNIKDKSNLLTEFNNFLKINSMSKNFLQSTNIIIIISSTLKESIPDQTFTLCIDIIKTIVLENINEKILYSKYLFKIIIVVFEKDFDNYRKIMKDILSSSLTFLPEFEELMSNHFKKLIIKEKLVTKQSKTNFLSFIQEFLNLSKFINSPHVHENYSLISSRLVYFLELIFEISLLEKVNNLHSIISKDMIESFIQIVENQDKRILEVSCNRILKIFYKLIDINCKSLDNCKKILTFLIKLFNKHMKNCSEQIESLNEIFKLLNCFFIENSSKESAISLENILTNKLLDTNYNFHYLIKHLLLQLRENIIYIQEKLLKDSFQINLEIAQRTYSILYELVNTHFEENFLILRKVLTQSKDHKLSDILIQNSSNIYFQRLILVNYFSLFIIMMIKQNDSEENKNVLIRLFIEVFEDLKLYVNFIKTLYFEKISILEFYSFFAQSFLFYIKFDRRNPSFNKNLKLSILEFLMIDDYSIRLTMKNILFELISNEN